MHEVSEVYKIMSMEVDPLWDMFPNVLRLFFFVFFLVLFLLIS